MAGPTSESHLAPGPKVASTETNLIPINEGEAAHWSSNISKTVKNSLGISGQVHCNLVLLMCPSESSSLTHRRTRGGAEMSVAILQPKPSNLEEQGEQRTGAPHLELYSAVSATNVTSHILGLCQATGHKAASCYVPPATARREMRGQATVYSATGIQPQVFSHITRRCRELQLIGSWSKRKVLGVERNQQREYCCSSPYKAPSQSISKTKLSGNQVVRRNPEMIDEGCVQLLRAALQRVR